MKRFWGFFGIFFMNKSNLVDKGQQKYWDVKQSAFIYTLLSDQSDFKNSNKTK